MSGVGAGNEKAGALAKQGAEKLSIGLTLMLGIPKNKTRAEVRDEKTTLKTLAGNSINN